jgi:serine/threonine protein kinase
VKIGDFGFCTLLKGNLKNFLGTFCYAAPEILMRKKYDGKKIDIFSLGIILFVIVTGKKFFLRKETEFFYLNYKNNAKENYEKFIEKLDKECLNFSLNFRDLCFKMIKFEPDERPDYFDIKNHEWLKNIDVSQFEMENHFKSRDDFVRDKIEEDKILKEIEGDKNCESFWFL